MRRSRRIAVSTAVTTGLLGLGGIAVAAVPGLTSTPVAASGVRTGQSAADRLAMQQALATIEARTKALGGDLTAAQRQLAAARLLAQQRAAAAARSASTPTATPSHQPTRAKHVTARPTPTTPPTHTTTGASGSSGDDGGSDGGGGSDD